MYEAYTQGSIILLVTLLLIFLPPAYANGGHMHLGGMFFLILGGVMFMGGLFGVFYLLFRPGPEETSEESEPD